VTEQDLNGAQIGPGFEQMGGEGRKRLPIVGVFRAVFEDRP
jgi:hypothetical protein